MVPVNIRETESGYDLHLPAPGRQKADFKLTVEAGKTLLISYDAPAPTSSDHWLHQEFKLTSFSRSVKLTDRADVSGITATYEEGILMITIPKCPEEQPLQKEIPVV
jgi:HSP20 family protein